MTDKNIRVLQIKTDPDTIRSMIYYRNSRGDMRLQDSLVSLGHELQNVTKMFEDGTLQADEYTGDIKYACGYLFNLASLV